MTRQQQDMHFIHSNGPVAPGYTRQDESSEESWGPLEEFPEPGPHADAHWLDDLGSQDAWILANTMPVEQEDPQASQPTASSLATPSTEQENTDYVPVSVVLVSIMSSMWSEQPLTTLFNTGATSTWISRRCLPPVCNLKIGEVQCIQTLVGNLEFQLVMDLQNVLLSEFHQTQVIESMEARMFEQGCCYDMILRWDILNNLQIKFDFELKCLTWDEAKVLICEYPKQEEKDLSLATDLLLKIYANDMDDNDQDDGQFLMQAHSEIDPEEGNDHWTLSPEEIEEAQRKGYKSKQILESKYRKGDITEVTHACTHLPLHLQDELDGILQKYPKLFSRELGQYKGEKIHLEIDPNVSLHQSRPYSVPFMHQVIFKTKLDWLVNNGVLEHTSRADWIAGTFVIPKKDGWVHWISNFWALNKALQHKVYPMPHIQDIMQWHWEYKYFTKIDVSIQYYTFELNEESCSLCTITTSFGLYCYKRLPMGIHQSPNIAQQHMESTLQDLQDVEIYLNNVAIFLQLGRNTRPP